MNQLPVSTSSRSQTHIFRRALPYVILLLLPLLIFAPVTLGRNTLLPADALYTSEPFRSAALPGIERPHNPLLADLVLENYPWQRFIVESVRAGNLPLWDPFLFAGHPFFANGQHSALYPLSLVFHLFPLPRAYGIFIALQLGLAGIWMYLLGRTLGARRLGAFLAGITFQFSGFLVVSVVHPMIVAAASWLPLLLALTELTIQRRSFLKQGQSMLPWAILGAVALGLQLLAGHAEITYFTLLVLAAFAAWRLCYTALTTPRAQWRAEVLSPAAGLLLMVALGLGLGAVQYIPLYEVVRTSFRQGAVTLEQVLSWAYPKRRILTFLVPNFFGNPTHTTLRDLFTGQLLHATVNAQGEHIGAFDWGIKNYVEGGAYLGLLPLLLALLAVFKSARRREGEKTKKRKPEMLVAAPLHALLHRAGSFLAGLHFRDAAVRHRLRAAAAEPVPFTVPLGLPADGSGRSAGGVGNQRCHRKARGRGSERAKKRKSEKARRREHATRNTQHVSRLTPPVV